MTWRGRIYKFGTKELNWDYNYNGEDIIIGMRGEEMPQYTKFDNADDLFCFQYALEADYMFEVVMGGRHQKPYFDFDIVENVGDIDWYDRLIDEFVCKISNTLSELDENINVLVFTSHTDKKLSYHVIIDGIYLYTNEHNRTFCHKIMTDNLRPYFDDLYSSCQQFRIYGCRKYGKNNKKIYNPKLSAFLIPPNLDALDREKLIYTKSLITTTKDCWLYNIKLEKMKNNRVHKLETVAPDFVSNRAINLFREKHKDYDFFTIGCIREINETKIIELHTFEPYHCRICSREHDNENPYLYISPLKSVYFNCRRTKQKERLGNITKL